MADPSSGESEGVTIQIQEPKESKLRHVKLGFLQQDNKDVCVVTSVINFMQRTIEIRRGLDQKNIKKITGIQPATVVSWVKAHMVKAGIDENYKPHSSIRSASSTKAVVQGIPIQKVREHANWSLNLNTFEKYYYKPPVQIHNSTQVQNSIFNTENSNTLESEAKTTGIVLGTIYNAKVTLAKDEEVVQTRP